MLPKIPKLTPMVRRLLKYGTDPSASLKAKFRYDVGQNLKLGDDGSRTCEMSPFFLLKTERFFRRKNRTDN